MNHGPWTTALGSQTRIGLSAFWRRRMAMLPMCCGNHRISRMCAWITALAFVLVLAPPTIHVLTPSAWAEASERTRHSSPRGFNQHDYPEGGVAYLYALGDAQADKVTWWHPEGRPLDAPYVHSTAHVEAKPEEFVRHFAIRWRDRPAGSTHWWSVAGGNSSARGEVFDENGELLKEWDTIAVTFPKDADTCCIRSSFPVGPWETLSSSTGKTSRSVVGTKHSFVFSAAQENDGNVAISIANNVTHQDIRVVATDPAGDIIAVAQSTSIGTDTFQSTDATFSSLSLAQVREFQFQARPCHVVECFNISLHPEKKTVPVTVVYPPEAFEDGVPPPRQWNRPVQ